MIRVDGETFLYSDQFTDDNGETTLVCLDRGNFVYIPEDEAEIVKASTEDKTLMALMDIAHSITKLNQNFEEAYDNTLNDQCSCDEFDDIDTGVKH